MQESRTITRKSASNLALAFVLLPKAKRDGMSALYAFCREVDDVADDESAPAAAAPRATGRLARRCPPRLRRPRLRNSPSTANCSRSSSQYHLPFEHFDALAARRRDGPRHQALRRLRGTGALLLSRGLGRRPAEHRSVRLPGPGLPRIRGLPRQGAATDQHPARRALRRPARPHLSAARPNWPGSR